MMHYYNNADVFSLSGSRQYAGVQPECVCHLRGED